VAATPAPLAGYRVRIGDTLGKIAAEHGVSIPALAAANGLNPAGLLVAGTSLRLPGGGAGVATAAPATTGTATAGGHNVVPGETLTGIAAANGITPASLAAAIAWQESGFNNAMRSVADARGIMQVIPATWDYVQRNLTSTPLDPASPADNVRAGSLLLARLLRETGDPATAVAAYYQGLGSVRRIGMLPETRQYVANVLALRSRFGG
jgi:soluble lytic murein transglycosylase-like protein